MTLVESNVDQRGVLDHVDLRFFFFAIYSKLPFLGITLCFELYVRKCV